MVRSPTSSRAIPRMPGVIVPGSIARRAAMASLMFFMIWNRSRTVIACGTCSVIAVREAFHMCWQQTEYLSALQPRETQRIPLGSVRSCLLPPTAAASCCRQSDRRASGTTGSSFRGGPVQHQACWADGAPRSGPMLLPSPRARGRGGHERSLPETCRCGKTA